MRPAMSLVNLLFLFLFLLFNDIAKGIRLEQNSLVSIHRINTQEAYLRGGRSSEEEVVCREGETCSGWNNRKMMMIKTREATASLPKSKDVKEIKANSDQSPEKESSTSPESYPDILDIAGMDYSPAKKKSPIHN